MAEVKRTGGAAGSAFKRVKPAGKTPPAAPTTKTPTTQRMRPSERLSQLTLPDGPDEPVQDMGEIVWAIHGEKKIGKTSLCSQFPDAFFFMCEPGGKGLRIAKRMPNDWLEMVRYIDLFLAARQYRTGIVDTVDRCYAMCFDHVCQKNGWDHPGDEGYGKGWKAIENEFVKQMDRLVMSGKGVIFISHTDSKEFLSRDGERYDKLVPTMAKAAQKYVSGIADVIAYYGYYGKKRYLTIQGSDSLEAGHRLSEKFRTPKGERVHSIPMGKDEVQAYRNILLAWDNQQAETHTPTTTTGLSDVPAPMTSRRRN